MKIIAAISACILSAAAWSDGQVPVTFSGKGKSGIEVRDASGKVTEVRSHSELRLNQIPADAVAREDAARAKRKELADEIGARRAEDAARTEEELKAAEEAAVAEAAAQAEAAAEAEAAAKLEAAQHPRKLRGKTVRGTRFVENPAGPPDAQQTPAGPVLSMSGEKKAPKESADSDAPAEKDSNAPSDTP